MYENRHIRKIEYDRHLSHAFEQDDPTWETVAERVALMGSKIWFLCEDGRWADGGTMTAVKSRLQGELGLNAKMVNDIVSQRPFSHVEGTAYAPGHDVFVRYLGKPCINTWFEAPTKVPDDADPDHPATILLMDILARNLCDSEPDHPDVQWVMHWLAETFRVPGKPGQTSLWFFGPAEGVGKSKFFEHFGFYLLGQSNVRKISNDELNSAWTPSPEAVLAIFDEVKADHMGKIKALTGNEIASKRVRGVGDVDIVCTDRKVFTSNEDRPVTLPETDRRCQMYRTSMDPVAKERMEQYRTLPESKRQAGWMGFARRLMDIDIDERLIERATMTPAKREVTIESRTVFEDWFFDHSDQNWPVGTFAATDDLKASFEEYHQEQGSSKFQDKIFYSGMRKLSRSKKVNHGQKRESYVEDVDKKRIEGFLKIDPKNPDLTVKQAKWSGYRNQGYERTKWKIKNRS